MTSLYPLIEGARQSTLGSSLWETISQLDINEGQEDHGAQAKGDDVNPYALELPASPHIAAKHEHVEIKYELLSEKLAQHKQQADVVLVEGAGGWRVPVSDTDCLSTWVQAEQLPVVLVVGIKLGCLSHALLTAESIKADGLNLVGWVANRVNPGTEHYADIIEMLEARIGAPKLGEIPYIPSAKRKELGKYINVEPLLNTD